MVWGIVFANGIVIVKEMIERQNSAKYKDMLSFFAVLTMELEHWKNYIFQQDDC